MHIVKIRYKDFLYFGNQFNVIANPFALVFIEYYPALFTVFYPFFQQLHIKIDKSFIDAIPNDHTTLKLIEAMILLAHTLNIKVIAEGVTSIKKIKTLDKYGCDQLQGHYFSRALPLKEIILFLKNEVKFKR